MYITENSMKLLVCGCSWTPAGPARREAHAFYVALGYESCAGFKKRLAGCEA